MRIAIIGGGINGLYLANKLVLKGHQITIFERKDEIGKNIICSGLFSQKIINFIPESKNLIKNRIDYVNIHFPKKKIKVNFSQPFFVIDHDQLDKLLAKEALKRGVKIVLNSSIEELPVSFDKIIGCDGAHSVIRKKLNLKNPKLRLGTLKIIPQKALANYVDVWPCKTGFSWKIPRGDSLEVGQIAKVNEIKIQSKSKIIPEGVILPKDKNITLCGDSAGLTKPWSGGGVIWGFYAADKLIETFPDFLKYRRKVKRFFLIKTLMAKTIMKLVYFFGFRAPWLLPKEKTIESDFLFVKK